MQNSAFLNDFQFKKFLGNVKNRKFNSVQLLENKFNDTLIVLKTFKKSSQNKHLEQFIRNESALTFENKFLPEILFHKENELEIKLAKKYISGIDLDLFWNQLKRKNQIPFLILFLQKLEPIFEELRILKIIHCDIKGSNFIIEGYFQDEGNYNFNVHLIDFGLAFYSNEVQNRKVIFSLAFSPPELILNETTIANHSSDLYSLGIMIYKLLTGNFPFYHKNPAVMTNLQLTYPLQKTKLIDSQLFEVLEKMCYKSAFHRPPNLLPSHEVKEKLVQGVNKRFQSLPKINKEISKINFDKKNLLCRLVKIFSNSNVYGKK